MTFADRFPAAPDGRLRPISWPATQSAGYQQSGGVDHVAVLVCQECGALVAADRAETHSRWHDRAVGDDTYEWTRSSDAGEVKVERVRAADLDAMQGLAGLHVTEVKMPPDDGQTHYVGDGCDPPHELPCAHDWQPDVPGWPWTQICRHCGTTKPDAVDAFVDAYTRGDIPPTSMPLILIRIWFRDTGDYMQAVDDVRTGDRVLP